MRPAWCHEVGKGTAGLVLTPGESLMAPLLPPVIIPRIHQTLVISVSIKHRERESGSVGPA